MITQVLENKGRKLALYIMTGLMLLGVFPRNLFLGLYFLIFLLIIFFYLLKKSDICNFADDKTLFFCGDNLSVILKSLEHDKILLGWFNLNSLKFSPGESQFMIFGKSLQLKYCLTIGPINAKESDHVELLVITIEKQLSFKKHTENLCRNASYKLHAFRTIRKCLTEEEAKLLGNAFIDIQINPAPLI